MSFIKKTWLARIGTGLNRFLQNGTDYVTLQSAPQAVTQQGDALSADNMNNLEQRITDAFDETAENFAPIETSPSTHNYSVGDMLVYNGVLYEVTTDIATGNALTVGTNIEVQNVSSAISGAISGKADKVISPTSGDVATLDSNGNLVDSAVPISTVLKQSDVIDNLTSPVTNKPLSANMGRVIGATLNQHDSRLQNLEQKAGDYVEVQYRGTNAVPTGKAKYALVNTIVGKTRAWNQLIKPISSASNFVSSVIYYTLLSNDGDGNLVGTSVSGIDIRQNVNLLANHKYIFHARVKASYNGSLVVFGDTTNLGSFATLTVDTYVDVAIILSPSSNLSSVAFASGATNGATLTINKWNLRDLTLIFGAGNEPSTVAEALTALPDLGKYDAYDAGSLVSTEVSGVKSVGVNIWDEEWEVGSYNPSTGEKESVSNSIRCKNRIEVMSGGTYYWGGNTTAVLFFYDAEDNYLPDISYADWTIGSRVHTLDSRVRYIRFRLSTAYGTTYKHDVQICLNSLPDAVKQTYHPYEKYTLELPQSVTLKSAGSVSDELDVESGEVTHPVGTIDMGDIYLTYNSTNEYFVCNSLDILPIGSESMSRIVNPYYEVTAKQYSGGMATAKDKTICQSADSGGIGNNVYIKDTSKTGADLVNSKAPWLSGFMMTYALNTPSANTNIGAITDNFIEVEGGGTIDTIQEQSPVIDNSLDAGYLAL